MPDPILTTKLYAPPFPSGWSLVSRPHLIKRLDAALQQRCKLLLISAPAGFGKTTLLSEWISHIKPQISDSGFETMVRNPNPKSKTQNPKSVWLSLDEKDNDPIRFWRYLIAALQTVQTNLGETTLAMLQAGQTESLETLTINLINDLAAQPFDLILVLDDYHLINSPLIHQTLSFLIEAASPQVHFCLSSRTQPPLPLARLRAKVSMIELDLKTIRFSRQETSAFLNEAMGLNLPPAEVEAIQAYTEGWIAGLKLAALSLQNQPERERANFWAGFTGQHPYIFDYFGEEVLKHQPPEIFSFLVQTSILERLNPGLANRVTGREDAEKILPKLEKANLFLITLDERRHWYRYHHLFQDFLRTRLQRESRPLLPELHRRAAAWYEQHGFTNEAIEHHTAAQNFPKVAQLIEQIGDKLWTHHEMVLLDRWISPLPESILQAHPKVMLLHAWALLIMRRLPAVEALLHAVAPLLAQATHPAPALQGILLTVQGAVAVARQDLSTAIARYLAALQQLPQEALNWRSAVQIGLGFAYRDRGNLSAAARNLSTAISLSMAIGNIYAAVYIGYYLGQLRMAQGRLQEALSTYQRSIELATGEAHAPLPIIAWPYLGLGEAYYEQNKLEMAAQAVLKAIRWAKQTGDKEIVIQSYLTLAYIKIALAQPAEAAGFIHQALHLAQEANLSRALKNIHLAQARLWFIQENFSATAAWLQESNLIPLQAPDPANLHEYLLWVRLLLAQNKGSEAQEALRKLHPLAPPSHRKVVFELQLLEALILKSKGRNTEAVRRLEPVLSAGKVEGYRRLFLDEGPAMAGLLQEALHRNVEPGYVTGLLAEFSLTPPDIPAVGQALIEPLSPAELDILKLAALGWSNQKIAQERVVTLNTVKWHLRNIYGKLGVKNRTAAASRAKALNLL